MESTELEQLYRKLLADHQAALRRLEQAHDAILKVAQSTYSIGENVAPVSTTINDEPNSEIPVKMEKVKDSNSIIPKLNDEEPSLEIKRIVAPSKVEQAAPKDATGNRRRSSVHGLSLLNSPDGADTGMKVSLDIKTKACGLRSIFSSPDNDDHVGYRMVIKDQSTSIYESEEDGGDTTLSVLETFNKRMSSRAVIPMDLSDDSASKSAPRPPRSCVQRIPVIHPESKFRIHWNFLIMIMLAYYTFSIPHLVCFGYTPWEPIRFIETVFECLFVCDIIFNFFTGYYQASGEANLIVLDRKMIVRNYLRGWFFIDLISIIPIGLFFETNNVNSLLRIMKMVKLTRIVGLWRYFRYYDETMKPGLKRMLRFALFLIVIIHYQACIFFWVSDTGEPNSWMLTYDLPGLKTDVSTQYAASLYWSITTMTTVGYGDVVPQNVNEVIVAIICMIISCCAFGYLLGNMAHLIASVDSTQTMYKEKMEFVREYMTYQNLPGEIQTRIKAYYSHCWKDLKSFPFSEHAILDDLSPALKREVVLHLNKPMVEAVPFFKGQDENFLCEIIMKMRSEVCAPLDFVVREGELGKCMYFIRRGLVEVCNKDGTEAYTTLSDGGYFGEIALLCSSKRTASVRAVFHSNLFRLGADELDEAVADYPEALKTILQEATSSKYTLSDKDRERMKLRFEDLTNMMEDDELNAFNFRPPTMNLLGTSPQRRIFGTLNSADDLDDNMPTIPVASGSSTFRPLAGVKYKT